MKEELQELDKKELNKNSNKEKKFHGIEVNKLILYAVALCLFIFTFLPMLPYVCKITFYFLTIILAGYELFIEGIIDLFHFKFEEETLMTIAVIAACALGEFSEACLVILLFCLGEFIESMAIYHSNEHIEQIVEKKMETANLYLEKGNIKTVPVEKIKESDTIFIKVGEMVPVDCKIISGSSTLDASSITGESEPIIVKEGQEILSGTINLSGGLICKAVKTYQNSMISQMANLVTQAQENKGKTEKFITKFSKVYTPTVLILALCIAVIPSILGENIKTWIVRSLVFLVASCPCSIVISIPLTFFSCIGMLAKKGLLVKGTKHIEDFAKAKVTCFDKTGTITTGQMQIDKLEIKEQYSKQEILSYLISLEELSNHPIASSIQKEIEKEGQNKENLLKPVEEYKEITGHGITGIIQGKQVLLGNKKLLETYNVPVDKSLPENAIYLSVEQELVAYFTVKEELRKGIVELPQKLAKLGMKKIAILTGDQKAKAKEITKTIENVEIYPELLPQDKLEKVKELKKLGKVIYVGDGINDSPVLASADFSIGMGAGAEIANSVSDSILITNQICILPNLLKIAKKSMRIIYFNISFSLLLKLIVLILGILGIAPIWLAVFADVGVTLITVLNSIRVYKE